MAGWNMARFMREVRQEVSKVVWPTRRETVTTTIVVLIFVALVSAFLVVVDQAISYMIHDVVLDLK